jgi:hypothetical protein
MADLTVKRRRPGVAKLRSTREAEPGDDALCHQVDIGKIVSSAELRDPVPSVGEPVPELEGTTKLADLSGPLWPVLFQPSRMSSSKRTLSRLLSTSRKHLDKESRRLLLHRMAKSILKLASSLVRTKNADLTSDSSRRDAKSCFTSSGRFPTNCAAKVGLDGLK